MLGIFRIKELGRFVVAGSPETAFLFPFRRIFGVLTQQNVYYVVICELFDIFRFLKKLSGIQSSLYCEEQFNKILLRFPGLQSALAEY